MCVCPVASDLLPLAQARYWRCARTASELRRDMRVQLAPSLRPWTLLSYWTMNEGLGQYVADVTEQHTRCFASGTAWAVSEAPPTELAAPDVQDGPVRARVGALDVLACGVAAVAVPACGVARCGRGCVVVLGSLWFRACGWV
jgi:hypothetical protein